MPLDPALRRHHVGIAGGSGITPILSIMKTVLAREPKSRFTLIYGNRRLASTMFKEELEDLKNRHLTRLALHHVFSDEPTGTDGPTSRSSCPGGEVQAWGGGAGLPLNLGLMDRAKIGEFLATVVPAAGIAEAYVCGRSR